MAALTVTTANVSADPAKGSIINNYELAEAINIGDAVALDATGKLVQALGSSASASRAIGILVGVPGMYENDITAGVAGGRGSVCEHGPVYGFSGMGEGTYAWVSKTTAGKLEDTAPGTPAYQYIVGQVRQSDVFFVNPGIREPVSV